MILLLPRTAGGQKPQLEDMERKLMDVAQIIDLVVTYRRQRRGDYDLPIHNGEPEVERLSHHDLLEVTLVLILDLMDIYKFPAEVDEHIAHLIKAEVEVWRQLGRRK